MTIKDTVNVEMKNAMKQKDKLRLNTMRAILGAFTEAETSGKQRKVLDEASQISVLKKMVKTRVESAKIYSDAGADDRALVERTEADIISEFLPQQLSEDEVRVLVETIIVEKNLADAGVRGIGQIMGVLKSRPDVDAGLASKIARDILS